MQRPLSCEAGLGHVTYVRELLNRVSSAGAAADGIELGSKGSSLRSLPFITFAMGLWAADVNADTLAGPASVINGDTIELHGQEVRLLGIDAPESEQSCWDASGQLWPCGKAATTALSLKIGDGLVTCKGMRKDRDKRLIAVCRAGDENLNAWLVNEGWALAYRAQSSAFVPAEEAAREGARGLWAGAFEPPWVWRTKNEDHVREGKQGGGVRSFGPAPEE